MKKIKMIRDALIYLITVALIMSICMLMGTKTAVFLLVILLVILLGIGLAILLLSVVFIFSDRKEIAWAKKVKIIKNIIIYLICVASILMMCFETGAGAIVIILGILPLIAFIFSIVLKICGMKKEKRIKNTIIYSICFALSTIIFLNYDIFDRTFIDIIAYFFKVFNIGNKRMMAFMGFVWWVIEMFIFMVVPFICVRYCIRLGAALGRILNTSPSNDQIEETHCITPRQ